MIKCALDGGVNVDSNVSLLDFNENAGKFTFGGDVSALEFVALTENMDVTHSVDYEKRDLYLKKHGERFFKLHKEKKHRKSFVQFRIKRVTKYLSKEARKNRLKLLLKKICNIHITININMIAFRNHDAYL